MQVNPLYLPQLKEVLSYPQSVGIVGGRPGASLYFLGYQGDCLLYLDPHEAQMCAPLPEAALSYFCDTVRLMPMTSMDPSLAIGFLCSSLGV
jgi:cysteine protease ATG4